ncbi:hypothetical protein BKA01_000222 [Pseudonocardia eucalypti]|nr:hypothetical protein [Pseudonocardia eucalypti]
MPDLAAKLRFDIPHSARIYDYWLGGKNNYPVDRAAGEAVREAYPEVVRAATQGRQFLIRTVRHVTRECGIRQYLDIGTGLPTMQNTHEVAQAIAPETRIVYVDNDPLVLVHARALLTNTTPEGVTTYADADIHNPDLILADARNVLNFNEPIGVIIMNVLGYVTDFDKAKAIVARIMDAVPSGSYLLLRDATDTSDQIREAVRRYAAAGTTPYSLRKVDEVREFFDGLELVEPGLVTITQWRPDEQHIGAPPAPIDGYGGVARKP